MTNPQREYFFYILASRSRNLYCGVTSKVWERVLQHKEKVFDGFTAKYNINRLVYVEQYSDIRDAIAREKQVKRWRRDKKLWLIIRQNPTWLDLSEGWYDSLKCRSLDSGLTPCARDDVHKGDGKDEEPGRADRKSA